MNLARSIQVLWFSCEKSLKVKGNKQKQTLEIKANQKVDMYA